MKRVKLVILSIILMMLPLISIGATGHIDGCTNTGYDTSCCTKTFKITPKVGYRVIDVIVNGISKGALTSYTFTNITEAQTLKVVTEKIEEVTYTVTFDVNGGSGSMLPQVFTVGTAKNLTTNTFTKSGYTFGGWATTQNGAVEYTDGQSYNGTENITLYAVWTTDVYTITYNLDGGIVAENPGTYDVDTATITLINPTKTGYTFKGWTGSNGNTPSTTVTIPNGSTGNKTYTANWELNAYTITYTLDGGTVTGNPSTYNVTTNTITLSNPTKTGYTFTGWTGSNGNTPSKTVTIAKGSTGNKTYTANWKVAPNSPQLGTSGLLTPVNWNGSSWVTTTVANWDYNYEIATANHGTVAGDGTGKWANAQTSDGSLYVWIPRYTYKIETGYNSTGNSWNSQNGGTNKILVKFSNGTTDDTSDSYIKHPAFTFGTDELKGIWVAKYEASRNDATASSGGSGTGISSKPGVVTWMNISVSKMYDYAYSLNRTLDSHLMKNSEWGAVAYLTSAIGRIPYVNNTSAYITGTCGESQESTQKVTGETNAWNTVKGVKATTTHNVYGIYDLSGGACEYVAAYYSEGVSATYLSSDTTKKTYSGSLYANRNTKYVETYSLQFDSSKTGDAIYETTGLLDDGNMKAWDNDCAFGVYPTRHVFMRGQATGAYGAPGIFAWHTYIGSAQNYIGFRCVLAIK